MSAPTLRLVLRPHPERSPNRTMRFEAFLGADLVSVSHQPLFDGARALLARGYPPETLLTTRQEDSGHDNVVPAPLGKLAGLTTEESDTAEARFRRYRPHPGGREGPPMRNSPRDGADQPDTEIAPGGEPS